MRDVRLRLLLALVAPAALALADETNSYVDARGTWTLSLPATWEAEVRKSKKAALKLKAKLPDAEQAVYFYLKHFKRMRGPRAQAYARRIALEQDRKGTEKTSRVELAPRPHVVVAYKNKKGVQQMYVATHRMLRRNGIELGVSTPAELWPQVRDALFDAIDTLESTVPEAPPRPEGYKAVTRDDYVYLLHPDVKKKVLKGLHKFVRDEEKGFARLHGKLVKSKDNLPVIIVHAKQNEAAELSQKAAEAYGGYYLDFWNRRLFAVPLSRDKEAQAYLGSALRSLFYFLRYGDMQPVWVHEGEVRAVWVEKMAGRKLPALSDGYGKSIPESIMNLAQLPALKDRTALVNQAFCWVAFFHVGPRKYQKAYRSFLKALGDAGDAEAALKDHLLALDQQKLLKEMNKFVRGALKE
ncbi:MAG: hypothetical protein ACYTEZ_03750 [Planctomycetota bacterium]|jgi:hypothetical protein